MKPLLGFCPGEAGRQDNFILIEGVYYEPWGKTIGALADLF